MREATELPEITQRVTLALVGLGPDGRGAKSVEQALRKLDGVRYVYVCPATEMAYLVYDGRQVRPDQFVAAVEQAGLHAGTPELR
jgi:copper chaperone CopZ